METVSVSGSNRPPGCASTRLMKLKLHNITEARAYRRHILQCASVTNFVTSASVCVLPHCAATLRQVASALQPFPLSNPISENDVPHFSKSVQTIPDVSDTVSSHFCSPLQSQGGVSKSIKQNFSVGTPNSWEFCNRYIHRIPS